MGELPPLTIDQQTASPLPEALHKGLIPVVTLAFLSFITSCGLFFLLAYRLFSWHRGRKGYNQFVVLIFNLVLADIQQSLAFLLNVRWLINDELTVGSANCWAQAWFVSAGDMASGILTLAIGVHTFASVIMNYRPSTCVFLTSILACWVFVYVVSSIGLFMHPDNLYVRAGAWCWIRSDLEELRLWTHYFWIFTAEFGTVLIYTIMFIMLNRKIRSNSFTASEASHARSAAKLMVVYPLVYVICTLPLASARMAGMKNQKVSLETLCFAGAMITSNGWLDVLLYTFTRRIMLFSDEPPADTMGVAAFQLGFFDKGSRFGNVTTIEALGRKHSRVNLRGFTRQDSMDELVGMKGVKAERTVEVRSDPMELADIEMAMEYERRGTVTPSKSHEKMSFDLSERTIPEVVKGDFGRGRREREREENRDRSPSTLSPLGKKPFS